MAVLLDCFDLVTVGESRHNALLAKARERGNDIIEEVRRGTTDKR